MESSAFCLESVLSRALRTNVRKCGAPWSDSGRRRSRGTSGRGARRERLGLPSFVVVLAAARFGRNSPLWATGIRSSHAAGVNLNAAAGFRILARGAPGGPMFSRSDSAGYVCAREHPLGRSRTQARARVRTLCHRHLSHTHGVAACPRSSCPCVLNGTLPQDDRARRTRATAAAAAWRGCRTAGAAASRSSRCLAGARVLPSARGRRSSVRWRESRSIPTTRATDRVDWPRKSRQCLASKFRFGKFSASLPASAPRSSNLRPVGAIGRAGRSSSPACL